MMDSSGRLTVDSVNEDFKASADIIARVHRAAAELPPIRPEWSQSARNVFDFAPIFRDFAKVARFLESHGRKHLSQGDLAGAWQDILASYRIARQVAGEAPTAFVTQIALEADRAATNLGLDWAANEKVTPELLRQASRDLGSLAPMPTLADVLKAEAPLVDRTLDLPGAELERTINGGSKPSIGQRVFEALFVYSWWERERARRLVRAEFASLIEASRSGQARERSILLDNQSREAFNWQQSPLLRSVATTGMLADQLDRATTGRLALVQLIALRSWAKDHNGAYPDSLDALVPGFLKQLPSDPYSAGPFAYVPSKGRQVQEVDLQYGAYSDPKVVIRPGQWLLISVGRDGKYDGDNDQVWKTSPPIPPDDLVFPLP